TNPPFSLFREYVAQLVEHGKQFLIIGSKNAITYKEVFKLIKENKLWLGVGFNAGNAYFEIPKENVRDFASGVYDEKTGLVKFRNVGWFTNMDFEERHQDIPLFKKYSPEAYPTYANYDAIEVGKVADIPEDYDGAMGVPITFLDRHNPAQFEVLGRSENEDLYGLKSRVYTTKECQEAYRRLFGKPGTYDMNATPVLDGRKVYQRVFIRRKH
ncbi:MAG: adenine-specific methyltransferase EcoRI family protein, partial [Fimbriimonadaceae bacterium]|nr:adenine-specific methyltransferase EcoRI family protein [Fimbriimonadaceae bacterium]